jgi:glutamate transport system permease protein
VKYLLNGVLDTLEVTAVCALVAAPIGLGLALARLLTNPVIRRSAGGFIELFRSVPLLLIIYTFLIVLPRFGLTLPIFWQLAIPIILSSCAALAEVIRAGILALPRGQSEAAYSIGLSYGQTMRLIVLPQALRSLAPALVSQLIQLLKMSTLGYAVSYSELLYAGSVLAAYTAQYVRGGSLIQTYLIISAFFILVNYSLSRLALTIERRLARGSGRSTSRADEPAADVATLAVA